MQISIVGDLPKHSAENCDVHWRVSTQKTFWVKDFLQKIENLGVLLSQKVRF
jgi:hypothetical protein